MLAAVACIATSAAANDNLVFTVTFDPATSSALGRHGLEVKSHILAAAHMWASVMGGKGATISIFVECANIPRASGRSVTSSYVGTVGGVRVFEQGAAAEIRTGIDPNVGQYDIEMVFSPSYVADTLWFDPDPVARTEPIPEGRIDAMSVMLHELGHALVYNGWSDGVTGATSGTYMSTWDRWLTVDSGKILFTGPSVRLSWGGAPDETMGNPFHWGNASTARPAPSPVPDVADGAPWRWDERAGIWCPPPPRVRDDAAIGIRPSDRAGTDPPLLSQLMNGVVFYYQQRYYISPLDIAALRDCGLTPLPPACPGDINLDGEVNTLDLATVLGAFGTCPGDRLYTPPADIDTDNPCVTTNDLAVVLSHFGQGCN